MSSTKRIRGDYYIKSVDVSDRIYIDTNRLTINGDLVVTGAVTEVESTNTAIKDNEIVLNDGESGAGVSIIGTSGRGLSSGIKIDRGTLSEVFLHYNESLDRWEATDDGIAWYPLNPTLVPTTFEVIDDLTPQLGGDLDVNGFLITSANDGDIVIVADGTGLVMIDQDLSLKEQLVDPLIEAGYNKLYAKVPGSGGTGLYTVNSVTEDELVSRKKAIVYSLIF